jgi:hypothetical protein
MKRRKKRSTSVKVRALIRRGRPSKADRDLIFGQSYQWIRREFGPRTLRQPVDPQFKPYYELFLQGRLRAILDYCDRNAPRSNDASFYELIGRLFIFQFYRGVRQVLSDIEHRAQTGWVKKRSVYEHWYTKLLPLCQEARKFIQQARSSCPDANRDKLWDDYVHQPLPTVRYGHLAGQEDEDRLQREANDRDQELRCLAIKELVTWAESHTKDSVRSRLSVLGCEGKELESLAEGNFHLENVNKFSPFGFVTREIFDDLALTRKEAGRRHFISTPAAVARRFACKIARF